MKYYEAANFLFDLRRFRMKPGTASTRDLLRHLDDPFIGPDYVQIAGSNGKGSTARMLESILREEGLNVGLYTSPHIEDIRRRILVNNRPITKVAIREYIESIEEYVTDRAATNNAPTFFEVLTGMALWYFGREDVDIAVLEVGIGGQHDATSVVTPKASAVTNVSLEHTDILGETIGEIARDKAHVAPSEFPMVTAASGNALTAIRDIAGQVVVVSDKGEVSVEYGGVTDQLESPINITGPDWEIDTRLPLIGAHQAKNAAVAATLAKQLADVPDNIIATGLRKTDWPGRFEVMRRDPLIVLDSAHNPEACTALSVVLESFEYDNLFVVYGAMHDKDHAGMASALPTPDRVYTCQPALERAEDRDVLARVFEKRGVPVTPMRAVESAVNQAVGDAEKNHCILVTGSLYTVAEARERWTRTQIPKHIDSIETAQRTLRDTHVTSKGVWRMRGKAVHRVVKTRVKPRQAQFLKEEMLSLGGECALSGLVDQDEEPLDIILMGTLAQFKRLTKKLTGQSHGLPSIASDIQTNLGINTPDNRPQYPWQTHPVVMGIINIAPDSFHEGGYESVDEAVDHAGEMIESGASIIDVGGESTRPGADPVPVETEIDRVIPVIRRLADLDTLISVDTRKAVVAKEAIAHGADILNDVSGLADPEMRFVAAEHDVPIVIMHSIETPVDPNRDVEYDDVVEDIIAELRERVLLAQKAGVDQTKIIVDPGLGFGKSRRENFELLGRIHEFKALGCPILVGHSHKSMFELIGYDSSDREHATVAASTLAVSRGADIVRVHDVKENVAAIRAVDATNRPHQFDIS